MGCRIKIHMNKKKNPKKNHTAHVVIFINVESSRQVQELLLDLNKRARVRHSDGDVKMWTEGQRESCGRRGGGQRLGWVSHCALSAVIILPRHLRRGVPHPDAHAFVTHGNWRMVYGSGVCVCVTVCGKEGALEVIRCQRWAWVMELWLPQHLID